MTVKTIRQTLTKAFVDWATEKNLPFVVPNIEYDPTPLESWAQIWFIEGRSISVALKEGEEQLHGIMQIDLNVPYGQGEGAVFELYESLNKVFVTGGYINNEFGTVRLGSVYLSGQDAGPPFYTKFVTVEYSAFT